MAKISMAGTGGLLTAPRRLGAGTAGYLLSSKNATVTEPGIYEPMPGRTFTDASTYVNTYNRMFYDPVNTSVWRSSTTNDVGLAMYNGSTWAAAIDATNRYCSQSNFNSINYFITKDGLRRLVGTSATRLAGVPEGLDPFFYASALNADAAQPPNSSCAYFLVYGYKITGEKEYVLGAPSGRLIVANEDDVLFQSNVLRFPLPTSINTGFFYQIYRTLYNNDPSVDPGEDAFLIYENYPTSSDISAGYFTFTDNVPEGNGGPALYTNSDIAGLEESYFQNECVLNSDGQGGSFIYKNSLFTWGEKPRSSLFLNLLGAASAIGVSSGLQSGITITSGSPVLTLVNFTTMSGFITDGMLLEGTGIPASTYVLSHTSGASGTITMTQNATATNAAQLVRFGDYIDLGTERFVASFDKFYELGKYFRTSTFGSPSENVDYVTRQLVMSININSTLFYARYDRPQSSFPGQMYLYARSDRASTYTVSSNNGGSFYPNITTAQTIESKRNKSAINWSPPGIMSGYPARNRFVFPYDAEITGAAVVGSVAVVATTRGIFRIYGDYGTYDWDVMDSSLRTAPGAFHNQNVVSLNNSGYFRVIQGFAKASETTVSLGPTSMVHNYLALNNDYPGELFTNQADGLVYVPLVSGLLVYDARVSDLTSAESPYSAAKYLWMMYEDTALCGIYNDNTVEVYYSLADGIWKSPLLPNQRIYTLGFPETVTIASIVPATNTVVLSVTPSGTFTVGDVLNRSSVDYFISTIVGSTLTLSSVSGLTTGAAQLKHSVESSIQYSPVIGDSYSLSKQINYANIIFDGAAISNIGLSGGVPSYLSNGLPLYATLGFQKDIDPTELSTSKTENFLNIPFLSRLGVPLDMQRFNMLVVRVTIKSSQRYRLVGVDLDSNTIGDKTK